MQALAANTALAHERFAAKRAQVHLSTSDESELARSILAGSTLALAAPAIAASGEPYLELFAAAGASALIIVPLIARGVTIGAMTFALLGAGAVYDEATLALAEEVAQRSALAIDNARLYAREHLVADRLQRAMLPERLPRLIGQELHAAYLPRAEESKVGGDWYDAFPISDGVIALSIGDVAGHGLEAAVVMGEVRQAFRAAALDAKDPASVLDRADRILKFRENPTMVTAIFGIFDARSGSFTYATAGHPPPILATLDGPVQVLPCDGLPLGIRRDEPSMNWTVSIPPGSLLTLYTDGLIEYGRDVIAGEQILLAAIQEELEKRSADPAKALQQRILGDRRHTDDVCILTLAVTEHPVEALDLTFTAMPIAAPLVRQAVRQMVRGLGLDEERAFALQVSIGEAVNNAIEHAYGAATPGTVHVRASRQGNSIVATVEDGGRWRPARREGRGRGLGVMRALMNGVQIQSNQMSTSVKLTLVLEETPPEVPRATG